MSYQTLQVSTRDSIVFLQIDRPGASNTIDAELVRECNDVLDRCEQSANIVVLSGSPEVFCLGADFTALATSAARDQSMAGAEALYDLWLKLATGPYITVAHVRGKANAGGVGFVAASDIVLANESAQFSLSELLFGLYPACVLPFLIRRIGDQRAHYMTLMTQPISAATALAWGLVDACEPQSDALLRRHLLRLRCLSKKAIRRYKDYMCRIRQPLAAVKAAAVSGNHEVFNDPENIKAIVRYVERGLLPWEK